MAAEEADRLLEDGYMVVEGVLEAELCDALREHVLLCTDEAKRLGRNDLFGNIQEAARRADLKLDLCDPVVEALNSLFHRCGPMLAKAMGGLSRLVELAAITSDSGAVAQPVHADTMHGVTRFLQSDIQLPSGPPGKAGATGDPDSEDEDQADDLGEIVRAVATETALIYTVLVALQDVEPEMGPTHVWPRTNTVEHHAALWGTHTGGKLSVAEADKLFATPHRDMLLRKGDLVMYDSRTMHCGGANMSSSRRSVFCVSTMGPGIRPDGTTWTMLKSLRNRLRLGDFPLSGEMVQAPVAKPGAVAEALPPPVAAAVQDAQGNGPAADAEEEGRPIPPLEEWAAAVQCSLCTRWRPCSVEEAPRLTGSEHGFFCKSVGFKCTQEQRYSTQEIDAIFG
uniref:CW-type domain-containing protein n=1 Tax=Alexandrium catenella TaxID=2925 RepID=A0A7S1SCK4_ALECA